MKKEFFANLETQRKANKKYSLSLMTDLTAAIERMKSFDLEYSYDVAFTEYEYALGLLDSLKNAADRYIASYDEFSQRADEQWEAYQEASNLFGQISDQLIDLGVEESPQLTQYGNDLAEGETQGQKAFDQTQREFLDHNELVDIIGGQ
tara:strand:- start:1550 stop:1996 length:447 start_codon:yes stop_codon:yes gene_type:complete